MIPFGSQRGGGKDLAVHLQNEHDNELVAMMDLRGSVADDLPGALAEWEAQADTMTKCKNFLYSLSINPDQRQGRLTEEQYNDYITRTENALGLFGQPRAVVQHIKDEREHWHVVWSRIDVQEMKAIPIAFDKQKLMMVTREFARDHGIQLPDGYYKDKDRDLRHERGQLSLYEKAQQDTTGLTKEERMSLVTDLWRQSDSAKAFVSGLEQHGYMLATGKRDYVLVDMFGNMNSLPKLIDDNFVRTKDVRAFLGEEYPKETLPDVEEARALAEDHRQAVKHHDKVEKHNDRIEQLKADHAKRREQHEQDAEKKLERHKQDRKNLEQQQLSERSEQRSLFLAESKRLREERDAAKPQGLAGFLAKVTGVELIRNKIHQHQDKQRHEQFQSEKAQLLEQQQLKQDEQHQLHETKAYELARQKQNLKDREVRELQSLEKAFKQEQAKQFRKGHEHMPSVALDLKPPGRFAVPHKAKNRFAVQGKDQEASENQASASTQDQPSIPQTDIGLNPTLPNAQQSEINKQFERAALENRNDASKTGQNEGDQSATVERFTPDRGSGNDQERER